MTKDDIIRMAREANLTDGIELPHEIEAVERFAALVAAAEREACARKERTMTDKLREQLDKSNAALEEAATELDRLHEVNVELMKTLAAGLDLPFDDDVAWFEWRDRAEAALAKATGENND